MSRSLTNNETPPGHAPSKRLDNIDLLRALAILAVAAFHYTSRYGPDYLLWAGDLPHYSYGYLGVELFFIVSGFCIFMTAERAKGPVEFLAKRLSRIQPAYMAAVLVTFCAVTVLGLPDCDYGPIDALANMVWLNAFGAPNIDGAYWSLIVELKFYLVFAVVMYGTQRWLSPVAGFAVFTCVSIVAGVFCNRQPGGYELGQAWAIAPHAPLFLFGMAIYAWDRLSRRLKAVVIGLYALNLLVGKFQHSDPWVARSIVGLFAPLSFYVLRDTALKIPAPLRHIGLISYPLYLVHENLGLLTIRNTPFLPNDFCRMLAGFAVAYIVAVILHYTVETRWRITFEDAFIALFQRKTPTA